MEENEKYEMIKCPHCQKDVTHIEGTDYICPYCGKSLSDEPEKESRLRKIKQYILKNKVLVAITACLVIFILAMSGTVSSAVDERDLMSDQLQEQTKQYEDLQSDYEDLSAKFDDLQSSYNDLETELTNYQDQQETIDTLNTQLTDLQEKYDTLSAENEELKAENEELNAQVAQSENRSGGGGGTGSGGGILYIPGSSSESSNDSGSDMVWIPAHGEKYHSIPDCGTMNPDTASQVTRSSAETMGYDACSKCW